MPMKIIQNQVECHSCGARPYSGSVHDYRECECGSIAVDGGLSYLRRVGDIHNFTELSISLPKEAVEAAVEHIDIARETGRNSFGILCAAMRALRDNGVVFSESA